MGKISHIFMTLADLTFSDGLINVLKINNFSHHWVGFHRMYFEHFAL